jgi:protein-disulfide isomerase
MEARKKIVFATLILAVLSLVSLVFYSRHFSSYPFILDPRGTIVIGTPEAKIELVLFEDFQCSHCQAFTREIFPQIESRYIDSGQVRAILVPLPLFAGSRALTNAALTIFHHSPDQLFPFLTQSGYKFENQKVTDKALLEVAKKVGDIDLELLEDCIERHCYYADIDKNLKNARRVMKKNVMVPMLYINGVATPAFSFAVIAEEIEKSLASRRAP